LESVLILAEKESKASCSVPPPPWKPKDTGRAHAAPRRRFGIFASDWTGFTRNKTQTRKGRRSAGVSAKASSAGLHTPRSVPLLRREGRAPRPTRTQSAPRASRPPPPLVTHPTAGNALDPRTARTHRPARISRRASAPSTCSDRRHSTVGFCERSMDAEQ
jgi:hypothetical protein